MDKTIPEPTPESDDDNPLGATLSAAALPATDVRVYEYHVRLDPECEAAVHDQIRQARQLYNAIVAAMRETYDQMQAWLLERTGEEGRVAMQRIEALNTAFAAAKAANDEAGMKNAAEERREAWKVASTIMGAARKQHAADLREQFYSRIGSSATCLTYQVRCKAVDAGLGWATANDVLDRALTAWKMSMKRGQPPRFAVGALRMQDSLCLQFTAAGGVASERLLSGDHKELALQSAAAGRRKYGTFRFRLGAAKLGRDATGTVQMHRPVPPSDVSGARLVRRREADKLKWAVQLVLRIRNVEARSHAPMKTLAAVHFGWAADVQGRKVAGIADAADPQLAVLLQLPPSIEEDLQRAAQRQSARDSARDAIVPRLREIELPAHLARPRAEDEPPGVADELAALRRLPVQHVSSSRLHRLQVRLREADVTVPWLATWAAKDRVDWQAAVGMARRARARRRNFYRETALALARRHSAIVIEPLDLRAAAKKIDEVTGERGEFGPKARAGRTVAALYELEQEIRGAAADYGRAVFDLEFAETIASCAHCGSRRVRSAPDNSQEIVCDDCGAICDRKLAGAARAWQLASPGIEDRIVDFHRKLAQAAQQAIEERAARKSRMAAGRRAARERRNDAEGGAPAGEA